MLWRGPEPPCCPCPGVVAALQLLPEHSATPACRELMLTEATNPLTRVTPANSALSGLSDSPEVTQGGCSRGEPRALTLPVLSPAAHLRAAQLQRSDLLCKFSPNRIAFKEQKASNPQANRQFLKVYFSLLDAAFTCWRRGIFVLSWNYLFFKRWFRS